MFTSKILSSSSGNCSDTLLLVILLPSITYTAPDPITLNLPLLFTTMAVSSSIPIPKTSGFSAIPTRSLPILPLCAKC